MQGIVREKKEPAPSFRSWGTRPRRVAAAGVRSARSHQARRATGEHRTDSRRQVPPSDNLVCKLFPTGTRPVARASPTVYNPVSGK
jgi:hypothetical protein